MHRIILWFRNDLRLHDNYILKAAQNTAAKYPKTEVVPVYCFDPRFYESDTKFGTRKCGFNRTRFMFESVQDFRQGLEKVGSGLLVSHSKPEEFIPTLLGPEHNTIIY
jgi:deoxyribodipyrimidine photo-lyase